MIKPQCIGFLETPPLWKNNQFNIQQFEFPKLDIHSFQPHPIPKNLRLGHQMEHVFQQLIDYADAYEIVLQNLQIGEPEKTIGEIDFILKHKSKNQLIHVELTYKFYLIYPEYSNPVLQLIGPNKRDTFFKKIQKIEQIQFPLLHTEKGAKTLTEYGINHLEVEQQCCFKAQLFKPFGSDKIDLGILNEDCLIGYWQRFDDFKKRTFATTQFYMPTKSEWVHSPFGGVNWKSFTEILPEIDLRLQNGYAPMLWLKNDRKTFEKMFVV